ncbi:dTDP-4-dehydrorhamnose 3,5-epimerase family protein [Nocardia sp. CNY236]|uniref:dTDP-4-dehydrorhamnose 3,5-epimerase family protein n=1 Tax=Nocardia sp. CNY236 TaxID=1169152 RepID=UPI00048C0808|nr:dTDP-4-dehydrorhamnose 3,5-epimerase family protein [Nocardia sp. CNY236]
MSGGRNGVGEPTFRACGIEGAVVFDSHVHHDSRGLFSTPLRASRFLAAAGRPMFPVRDVSFNVSARGVLRGIHYTATPPGRAKYVCCPHGRVTDFFVDLRVGSPTFGHWDAVELGAELGRAVYLPIGIGHAFLAETDDAVIVYLMSQEYVPEQELAVSPTDPALGLPLPRDLPLLQSDRDRSAPTLAEAAELALLPGYQACRTAESALWA